MAKLEQGILGPFRGKVGSVVGYTWRGIHVVRAYRREIKYPNTERQQAERDWFVGMVRFASRAQGALKLGLREAAMQAQMTEGNFFVKSNKQCFALHDGAVEVDYAELRLAQGPAAGVLFGAPRFEEGEVVSVDYEKNGQSTRASSEDRVYLFAYAPELGEGLLSAPALRRSKVVRMRLPQHWADMEVHLYGFVVDRDGRASRSAYIGSGSVDAAAEEAGEPVAAPTETPDFLRFGMAGGARRGLVGDVDNLAVFEFVGGSHLASAGGVGGGLIVARGVAVDVLPFLGDDFHVLLAWIFHYGEVLLREELGHLVASDECDHEGHGEDHGYIEEVAHDGHGVEVGVVGQASASVSHAARIFCSWSCATKSRVARSRWYQRCLHCRTTKPTAAEKRPTTVVAKATCML